jgi:hypothetical protein
MKRFGNLKLTEPSFSRFSTIISPFSASFRTKQLSASIKLCLVWTKSLFRRIDTSPISFVVSMSRPLSRGATPLYKLYNMSFPSSLARIKRSCFCGEGLSELIDDVASVDPLAGVVSCLSLSLSLTAALVKGGGCVINAFM